MTARFDPHMRAYEDQGRHAGMIYVLMLVVALAFGGFLWQLYSTPEVAIISAPPGPYKRQPEAGASTAIEAAVPAETSPGLIAAAPAAASAVPGWTSDGPYVAQLAALQSEAAIEPAWRRLSSRAPDLFAPARLDVERADLGARGVYYRVRAGYFADRTGAARFCERIRQLGQDCIATAR